MDDVFEDVSKVMEQIYKTLGHDTSVDPNKIFAKLESLPSSSSRVETVTRDIISEIKSLKRTKDISKVIVGKSEKNSDNEVPLPLEPFLQAGQEIVIDEESRLNNRANNDDVVPVLDPESHRSTPASIISITTDEDSQEYGTIDLTTFEDEIPNTLEDDREELNVKREGALNKTLDSDFNTLINIDDKYLDQDGAIDDLLEIENLDETAVEEGLRTDTEKVMRILASDQGPLRDYDEIYAYLEAHIRKKNRVQIVVEEFLGMTDRTSDGETRSPSPDTRMPSPIFMNKCKGKGKGKRTINSVPDSKRKGANAISPDVESQQVKKREHSPDDEKNKKIRIETVNGETSVKLKVDKVKTKREKQLKGDPITEEMLYGPFDFTKHRQGNSKANKRTQNLAPILQDIVEDASRKITLTPSRLSSNYTPAIDTENILQSGSSNAVIAPAKLKPAKELSDNPPSELTTPVVPKIHAPKLILPGSSNDRKPSIELVDDIEDFTETRELVEIPDKSNDIVEIHENENPATSEQVQSLADSLCAMFPETPAQYILARCQDLVGKNAAINRFTEELLDSPNPPDNWKLIYKPFDVVKDSTNDSIIELSSKDIPAKTELINGATSPSGRGVESLPSSSHGVMEDNQIDSALPSTSSTVQSEVIANASDPDVDPIDYWETERQEQMISMFPSICPDWLLHQVQSICRPQDNGSNVSPEIPQMDLQFQAKVEELFSLTPHEVGKLPTRVQWEAKKKERAELEKWSGKMSVTDMLELYADDPDGYFNDPQRKPDSELYKQHAIAGLKGEFRFHSITEIEKSFRKCQYLYTPTYKLLKQMIIDGKKTRKTQRPDFDIKYPADPCIEFLKEKKFCELEDQIIAEKARRVTEREAAIEFARARDELVECKCCYSTDCLAEDMIKCKGGHMYCKECISRGTSVAIGDGKTIIECLGHCQEEIGWQELQKALAPNVLSKLLQRRQAEEVGAAGLESLVTCPFCPYQTIMENMDDKILACRNPECGRESCRLCKEPSHVPLRCDEVEKKDEEAARKKIEEQLSEAMIRECWKCKAKYFKEEGCNKMTCPKPNCGAKMCYLCKQPVKDYTHFYGQGGSPTATKTCPLWTDNKRLHEQEIANAAAKAKEELAKTNVTLKHDPTKGIKAPAEHVGIQGLGVAAPDLAEVIAPGVPRDEIVRQQRQIEEMIRRGARGGPVWLAGPHGQPPVNVPMHAPHAWQDGFIQRMGEILRLREQNRANLRMVRQREQQAIRELQRQQANQHVGPIVDNGIQAFGIPQAVPEPAPFLDLVEAQGRNIHVVQQQRLPLHVGPGAPLHHVPYHRHPFRRDDLAGLAMRRDERRHRHNMFRDQERRAVGVENNIREQLEETRRRAVRLEQDRLRERQMTEQQRERMQRSREDAVRRLRRNREEVLRRQRRNRDPLGLQDLRMERRVREGVVEAPMDPVANGNIPIAPGGPHVNNRAEAQRPLQNPGHRDRVEENRNGTRAAGQGENRQTRGFNFQEILNMDALNPDYLGEDIGNAIV